MIRIAVDAMGGDNAPKEIVKGAVEAVNSREDICIKLVGTRDLVEKELASYSFDRNRIDVVCSTEVIETGEPPVDAIRKKKDSSLVVALKLVKEGEADAFVSSGSTGAVLVGGQLLVGKLKGVKRAPLAPIIPTKTGVTLLIDCGANVDSKAQYLVQYARMGSLYMEHAMGIKNPRVGLINVGTEEEKGNALVKETYGLLKQEKNLNFIGNIEAREVPEGAADVCVCDAFVGNVLLKTYEGVGNVLLSTIKEAMLSNFKGKLGALLVKNNLKTVKKKFSASEYGGAPLLGLKGLVVKSHGNATAKEIKNAILQCESFARADVSRLIEEAMADEAATGREE